MAFYCGPIADKRPTLAELMNLQITDCAFCRGAVAEPRLLPCIHTFCLTCLEDWAMDKLPGDNAECPLCEKSFVVPERGPSGLQKNRFVEKLKQSKEQEKSSSQGCSCDRCSKNAKKKPAISFCSSCKENLCGSCFSLHMCLKITGTHNFIRLCAHSNAAGADRLDTRAPSRCDKHPNKAAEMLCEECHEIVCTTCFADFHNTHKCSVVETVAKDLRQLINNDCDNVSRGIEICRGELYCLDDERRIFTDRILAVKKEIGAEVERIKQIVDLHAQTTLLRLDTIHEERIKQIDGKADMVESQVHLLEGLRRYFDEIVKAGSSSDIVQQTDGLHCRSLELLKFNPMERSLRELGFLRVDFTPTRLVTEEGENVVGSVDARMAMSGQSRSSSEGSTSPQPCKPALACTTDIDGDDFGDVPPLQLKVERVTPAGSSVRGVTSLGDKLFVVRHPCRQRIEVYDTTTLNLRCHILVTGLQQSYGLASCAVNNCLYVSDYYRDAIYRVHIAVTSSGDITAITSWQVSGGPLGVSVTSSSRTVIVTCSSVHGQSKLKEYTSDGTLVRKIRLLSDLTYCCHAVEVANPAGHFAVSHGGDRQGLADVSAGCVYLVDADGRIVRCFGNRRNQALTLPRQLAISKLGCIVVADQQRGRLLLLGSSFASSRDMTVANDGGLRGPYALCLDESRSRLYIGEMNGGRIFAVTNWSM